MTPIGFLNRLRAGKVVNCTYRRSDLSGHISAWAYGNKFVLTWEECRDGDQYNEQAYIRDERHEFHTVEDVLAFVEQNGHPVSAFSP